MAKYHRLMAFGIVLVLSGCTALHDDKQALRITPRSEVATSPVVREVLPQPAPPPAALPAPPRPPVTSNGAADAAPRLAHVAPALTAPPAVPPAAAAPNISSDTLYVCTTTVNGQVRKVAIEFEPRVKQLCGKHPEMGVCQYEREACRASGGRVHTAKGVEITRQTEAEYNKKVLRVRLRAG